MGHNPHTEATWPPPALTESEDGPFWFWYLRPTLRSPMMPLAVTDQPPPGDMPMIGAVRVGSSGVAHALERISFYTEDALRWTRFLKLIPGE